MVNTFTSDLKKNLITLHKSGIISEKQYIRALEELKSPTEFFQNQLLPLLDMLGLKHYDYELKNLNQSLEHIDTRMRKIAKEWETGNLPKTETKKIISELVFEKKSLIIHRNDVQQRIMEIITRLKSVKERNDLDLDRLISLFIQPNEDKRIIEIATEFNKIWKKYSLVLTPEALPGGISQKLNDVEIDILSSLMVPITEKDTIVLDLDDVIPPIERSKKTQPLPRENEIPLEIESRKTDMKPNETVKEILSASPWNLVGRVAYNSNNKLIGIFRPPIVVNGIIYLPIVMEEPLSISKLKKQYKDVLKQAELDLKTTTTQMIKTKISKDLEVPEKLALQPSIFNQWIAEIGVGSAIPARPKLTKVQFVEPRNINELSSGHLTIQSEKLKQLQVPAWIPAPGITYIDSVQLGEKILGMAGSNFGTISGIMNDTPFGQSLIIKRNVPPSYLLNLYLEGLGIQNLSELRFNIAKTLNIGEGESFLAENLWTVNNQERLLISPHEIAVSYYSILPSDAFSISNIIKAKIGVYFNSISEIFRYLIGKPFIKSENEKGIIYGFSIMQDKLYILWSSKNSVDIIKEVGRKSSERYVNRFKQRMSLALGISYQESLWPSNMARYFLNFIWMTENQTLLEAMRLIEERFSLNKDPFSEVQEITVEGLKCKNFHG